MTEEISSKAKGGFARAETLSKEERSEIARKGALARWKAEGIPRAEYTGELKIGNISIPCAVLEDGRRMITQWGFYRAIGRSGRPAGGWGSDVEKVAPFLALDNIKPYVSEELAASKPVQFQTPRGGKAWGYNAELLPKVCEVYLQARDDGKLLKAQLKFARACEILMRSLAHIGIIALVDEATGYQGIRPKDALQAYLEKLIRKELAAWAKKFPDEFYENIYKLKNWPWPGMQKNRYSVVAHYTRDLVYERIAPGLLSELERKSPPNEKGRRPNKLHQWLTEDVGNPMLAQHLYSVIMFQRLALNSGFGWHRFIKLVDKAMPKRGNTLELPFPDENLAEA